MEVIDLEAAISIVDHAIGALDEFDAVYRRATGSEGPAFRTLWEESLEIENTKVMPRLELARQIATHIGAEDLLIMMAPDKGACNSHPFEANRTPSCAPGSRSGKG